MRFYFVCIFIVVVFCFTRFIYSIFGLCNEWLKKTILRATIEKKNAQQTHSDEKKKKKK